MRKARFFLIGFAALLSVACGIPEEEYNAKVAEINKLNSELAASVAAGKKLDEELALARAENEKLASRLDELGENVDQLLGEKSVLAADLAATREREARLKAVRTVA